MVPIYQGGERVYAVIETGGKQYKVMENDVVAVEKLPQQAGERIVFERVLHLSTDSGIKIGTPFIENCAVEGTVLEHARDKKVTVVKYRPRKNYRREKGHRQWYSLIKIDKIRLGSSK